MVEIKAAKRKGDGLLLNCNRTEGGRTYQSPAENHPHPIHPNLDAALNGLRIHFACIMNLVNPKKIKDVRVVKPEMLEDFRINGFSVSTKGDGVVLKGMVKSYAGKWSALNTSLILFEQEETTRYLFMDQLIEDLDECKARIQKYLGGEEIGEAKQTKLELPDATEPEEVEAEEETQ